MVDVRMVFGSTDECEFVDVGEPSVSGDLVGVVDVAEPRWRVASREDAVLVPGDDREALHGGRSRRSWPNFRISPCMFVNE